ncbi:MAG: hypothetical protein ABI614_02390 [Planctomycetota bacterium]
MRGNKSICFHDVSVSCVCVVLLLLTGCSKTDETLHQHFVRTQVDIATPDGVILPETVTVEGESVHYQTDRGGHWRIRAMKQPDGYHYSDAERVPVAAVPTPDS